MNAAQFMQLLWVRRWYFSRVVGCTIALAIVVSLIWPDVYVGTTSVVIDPQTSNPISGAVQAWQEDPSVLATQVDVISSQGVALKVVDRLNLTAMDYYRQKWELDTGGLFGSGGIGSPREWIAQYLREKKLFVQTTLDSNVIDIKVKAPTSQLSAQLANAYADAYIATDLELRAEPARRQAAWYRDQLADLRQVLESAKAKLTEYQLQKSMVAADDRLDVEKARLTDISTQLVAVQTALFDALSRQKQMSEALARNQLDQLPDILGNVLLQTMKADLVRAEGQFADIAQRYDQNHPEYRDRKAEVDALKAKLTAEINRIQGSIEQSAEILRRQEADLRGSLDKQRDRILQLNNEQDKADVLRRDVDNAQKAYDAALQRTGEMHLEGQFSQSGAAILAAAAPPPLPKWPKIPLNLFLSVFLGAMLGAGLIFLGELRDPRVRSTAVFSELTGLVVLAEIPKLIEKPNRRRWLNPRRILFLSKPSAA